MKSPATILLIITLACAPLLSRSAVDSIDLSATLLAGEPSPRDELAYYRRGELYAYRVGPWKAHFITEGAYGQPPVREEHATPQLYNLLIDPSERFDVAADHPAALAIVMQAVEQHRAGLVIAPPEFDKRLARLAQPAPD